MRKSQTPINRDGHLLLELVREQGENKIYMLAEHFIRGGGDKPKVGCECNPPADVSMTILPSKAVTYQIIPIEPLETNLGNLRISVGECNECGRKYVYIVDRVV